MIARRTRLGAGAALTALPAHYRAVIELRHFQEMDYDEMAKMLQLPIKTVKSHLFRARKLL
ncbi:MAG: RNA polymerase sigma factor, partial [Sphingomonas sp.]